MEIEVILNKTLPPGTYQAESRLHAQPEVFKRVFKHVFKHFLDPTFAKA